MKGKSYPCTWGGCTKEYTRAGSLKTHLRTHRGKTIQVRLALRQGIRDRLR